MAGLIVILLYACKLAFLASSTCVKRIEFLLKNEAKKAYLHVHKRIIIMHAIMKEVYISAVQMYDIHIFILSKTNEFVDCFKAAIFS